MLTRLQDRIETSDDGEVVIRRYGMWGTTAEIEVRPKGPIEVVFKNKVVKKFKRLIDAELYLKEIVNS